MLEYKEWTRDNRIFSRGIDVLAHTPNPRCDTHKESCHLPSHRDEGAHKESPFTIPAWWRSSHVQSSSPGSHNPWQAPRETLRSPRSSRCCQTPRVTSF